MANEEIFRDELTLERGGRWAAVAGVVGLIGFAVSALLARSGEHGAERFFHSYLIAYTFFLSLALGALFFVMVTHLTRAGWSVALRRISESVSLALIVLAPLALVVFWGRHDLYEWTHLDVVANDPVLRQKAPYLNEGFFALRLVGYFVVWIGLALFFWRTSVRQDESGDPTSTLRMERVAAPATILYALTVTFAAFDLLMSLYPHWFSTIFGVYYFSGAVLSIFCTVTLLAVLLQRAGKLSRVVTSEHFHDLGKLMFAFVVFWAYIAFSQYMLIWYAHIPEETEFYLSRHGGEWGVASLVLLFGHFVIPFLWLISRHPKRRTPVLALAACWLLLMHWFDLFWLVIPKLSPDRVAFHPLDLSTMLGIGGLFFAVVFWCMSRVRLIPVKDPRIKESLGFENA